MKRKATKKKPSLDDLLAKRGLMVRTRKSRLDAAIATINRGEPADGVLYLAEHVLQLVATAPRAFGDPIQLLAGTLEILKSLELIDIEQAQEAVAE